MAASELVLLTLDFVPVKAGAGNLRWLGGAAGDGHHLHLFQRLDQFAAFVRANHRDDSGQGVSFGGGGGDDGDAG